MYLRSKRKPMALRVFLCLLGLFVIIADGFSQSDSVLPAKKIDTVPAKATDTSLAKKAKDKKAVEDTTKWSPGKRAAVYSAIFPGAGQIYNKKYWKLPLVYGVLAIPTYTFVDNLSWFNKTRLAFNVTYNIAVRKDSTGYKDIDPRLIPIVDRGDQNALKNYRNTFRRNVDYSALAFILLWGLNVVDAAVDGHLRDFNISDDLSLQIKPGYMPIANTTGVGLVLNIGKNHVNRSSSGR